MSTVPCIFYYDGELFVDEEGKPRYVGGKRKGSEIKNYCTFAELKRRVYEVTKVSPIMYDLKLAVKWVRDDGSSAIDVEDDDDLRSTFSVGMRVVEIFITKVEHIHEGETQQAIISNELLVPQTHVPETQLPPHSSYLLHQQQGEFTNLLQQYTGLVGASSNQTRNIEHMLISSQTPTFEK